MRDTQVRAKVFNREGLSLLISHLVLANVGFVRERRWVDCGLAVLQPRALLKAYSAANEGDQLQFIILSSSGL